MEAVGSYFVEPTAHYVEFSVIGKTEGNGPIILEKVYVVAVVI